MQCYPPASAAAKQCWISASKDAATDIYCPVGSGKSFTLDEYGTSCPAAVIGGSAAAAGKDAPVYRCIRGLNINNPAAVSTRVVISTTATTAGCYRQTRGTVSCSSSTGVTRPTGTAMAAATSMIASAPAARLS